MVEVGTVVDEVEVEVVEVEVEVVDVVEVVTVVVVSSTVVVELGVELAVWSESSSFTFRVLQVFKPRTTTSPTHAQIFSLRSSAISGNSAKTI